MSHKLSTLLESVRLEHLLLWPIPNNMKLIVIVVEQSIVALSTDLKLFVHNYIIHFRSDPNQINTKRGKDFSFY